MHKMSLWCTRISQNLDFLVFIFFLAKTVPNLLLLLFLLFFLLSYPRSFSLSTSFLLAGKVWRKSSVNPEKGTLISSRCVGLFMHRFCTRNGVFFSTSSVRMQSIYKMHSPLERSILASRELLIWKVDWRGNWWRHRWFNDHYSESKPTCDILKNCSEPRYY